MSSYVARLLRHKIVRRAELKGCSKHEIRKLEQNFGLELPGIYVDFLRAMGRSAGHFLIGTDVFYKHLFKNRDALEITLEECDTTFELPHNAFVFLSHQEYTFCWFVISEGDDPPIYNYTECEPAPRQVSASFTNFLEAHLAHEVRRVSGK